MILQNLRQFLDIEAQEASSDEDTDFNTNEEMRDFLNDDGIDIESSPEPHDRTASLPRNVETSAQEAEAQAQELRERWGVDRSESMRNLSIDDVPQHFLMPAEGDPGMWMFTVPVCAYFSCERVKLN